MSTLDLNTVELVSTLRKAPANGSPSSQDYNDTQREILADIAAVASFANDVVLPLIASLPQAALEPTAAPTGIEGRTVFADTSDKSQLFYNEKQAAPLTLADSLRVLSGMVTAVQNKVADLNSQVNSMQARLASDSSNDISIALQGLTETLATVQATQRQQTEELAALDFHAQSVRTNYNLNGGETKTIDVEWPDPYADGNFTVSVSLEDLSGTVELLGFYHNVVGTSLSVRLKNTDVANARAGVVHVLGIS